MLSVPLILPPALTFVDEGFCALLAPFDLICSPVLKTVALRIGIPEAETSELLETEEELGANAGTWLSMRVGKRVLLGALVLNVISSAFTLLSIACFVGLVRMSGIYDAASPI